MGYNKYIIGIILKFLGFGFLLVDIFDFIKGVE